MLKSRFFAVVCAVIITLVASYFIASQTQPNPVPDYPINFELKHSNTQINISHKVTYDSTKKIYRYYFCIENQSDETYIVSWDVINKVKGHTSLLIVSPKEAHHVWHESKFSPKFQEGQFLTFKNATTTWEPIKELSAVQIGPVPNENP